jgi:hypothetical protein
MKLIDENSDEIQRALSEGAQDEPYDESDDEGVSLERRSDSDADSEDSGEVRVPRAVMVAFREAHGISLREKSNKHRFTKTTNPI